MSIFFSFQKERGEGRAGWWTGCTDKGVPDSEDLSERQGEAGRSEVGVVPATL